MKGAVAIVLAAGASTRMGRQKQTLPFDGGTMLGAVVGTTLAAPFDEVRVVVPEGARYRLPADGRLVVVENRNRDEGMASSLRAGSETLPDETATVAIVLADLPLLRADTVRKLLDAAEREPDRIVFPRYEGRRGHPVLFPRRLVGELRELRGDRGARAVLERHRDEALALDVEDPGVCLDIDTPRDYASVMRGDS